MKVTQKLLENLVDTINEESKLNIKLDKNLYGYAIIDADRSKVVLKFLSVHERKSALDMWNYLQGLLQGIRISKHF